MINENDDCDLCLSVRQTSYQTLGSTTYGEVYV